MTAATRLLDVGTGTGTVAALAIGRGATVTAVDAEPSMVAAARDNIPAAEVVHGVLPRLPFGDGAFDAVVANFVVNHVGDPAAAVAELRRLVRFGGRVAVTVWPHPQPPLQRLWADIAAATGLARPASAPTVAADRNFERTPAGLAGLLADSGLTRVECRRVEWIHRADPEDWWAGPAAGLGSLGAMLTVLSPAELGEVRAAYDRLTAPHLDAAGRLALPTSALLATATAS
ncbi:class I SAM-dependent methyltransferase [Catellatospora tritici]|uniref:class I SAM-dependent methyltransferase n=1 Tax=Catellatospora tritici TaxID=2851566 RepID=UPI001C2DA2E2|nr:class I SAM-dependent methyltransferase [Catellatospora tritici]MBV1851589.1 methyltransferase domain-containing protein [Catellatospora tritici]